MATIQDAMRTANLTNASQPISREEAKAMLEQGMTQGNCAMNIGNGKKKVESVHQKAERIKENLSVSVVVIGPEEAKAILGNNPLNRPIKKALERRLSADMLADAWSFTGEPIVIGDDETLMDGQHRLTAVVKSGKPQVFLVVSGVESESRIAIDNGASRTFGDYLTILEVPNAARQAAITGLMLRHRKGYVRQSHGVSNSELFAEYTKNAEDIADAASKTNSKTLTKLMTPTISGFVYLYTQRIDPDASIEFFKRFVSGIPLYENDPVITLRSKLDQIRLELDAPSRSSRGHTNAVKKLAYVIKAWNCFVQGGTLKYLRWSANAEKFPQFVDAEGRVVE